ncbi:MAG: aminotransferase class I/II-fold pyridoxal phosphate-dependent enzyme [Solirubrobacteraceae bacterium]
MVAVEQYHWIRGATAREIAASAESAIRDGALASGDALPTVRGLAGALGTSPATVNSAYRMLRERGFVVGQGRRGTRVARRPALRAPGTAGSPPPIPARADLSIGLADPALLPPIAPALARIDIDAKLGVSRLEAADPELLDAARLGFEADGVPSDALAVVSGAMDGVERVLAAHLRPGDRVIVEDPCYPPIRDVLLALGLVPVPVAVDDMGMIPDLFGAALDRGVQAVVTVPRAQNPLGAAVGEQRAAELRASLAPHGDVLIVEDDHASLVAGAPFRSLADSSWPRWAVIRALSKMLHPDLRVALVAGDPTTIARVEGRQALGPRWVSHILQATAAELLRDPGFDGIVTRAREAYAARREALTGALAEHDVLAHGRSGLNVWVPVREEAPVARALLDAGWLVTAGEQFRFASAPGIRVTTAALDESDAPDVAAVIAAVEHAGRSRRAY